jgi:integrase
MRGREEPEFEFLAKGSIAPLDYQQKILYAEFRAEFIQWLRQEGKNPKKHTGYKESNVRPTARRVHQAFEFAWEHENQVLELVPENATRFLEALNQDRITTKHGDAYSETSKRKFKDALQAYFRFQETDWDPGIEFSDNDPSFASDPLTRDERERLYDVALGYQSPPTYSNLSPEERDRWKRHIAQRRGIQKDEISREDWKQLKHSWKVPSIISTALDAGWRAEMVGRLRTDHVDLENGEIHIPPEIAVKNDSQWTVELSERSTRILAKHIKERENRVKYDDTDKLWLNRNGNPYNSKTLNALLDNLLEEAGINSDGRTLTWHSIRHSTGMYVYDAQNDLGLVAEILRHKSLESARKYAHPTPETKRSVIEDIQGGA